jgi:iron complex outermembrane receptor protein
MRLKERAALLAGISFFMAPTAQAQEMVGSPGDAVASPTTDGGIADIIVTARRRSESLLETPVAVSAFNAEELERRSIMQAGDLQSSTPSLVYEGLNGNTSEARIFIRGVGNGSATVSAEQGVGVYIDGVYFARSQAAMIENLDIASIEVLRGPQGTLFGKNTIGGAINITTMSPSTDALSGRLEAGYGNFDRVRVRGSVNIPLGDRLAVRLAALRDRDDGYSVNDFDGRRLDNRDLWVASGSLRFTPTDNLTWDVSAMYSRDRSNSRANHCVQVGPEPVLGAAFVPICEAMNVNGIRHTSNDSQVRGDMDMVAGSSTLAWDVGQIGVIDNLTIKAIGGYQWTKSGRLVAFYSRAAVGIGSTDIDKQSRQISGELQILGQAFDKRLNFTFGAYVDRERSPGQNIRATSIYPFLEPGRIFSEMTVLKLRNKSRALYSQMTYDFNDIVSVTGGLRYTEDTKGFFAFRCPARVATPTVCAGPPTTNGVFTRGSTSWTPMASLQLNAPKAWTDNGILDQAMAYFTFSKGFKSGGFNGNGNTSRGTLTSFEPERVENYEVGLKFSMFDRRLVGTLARYDMTYTDIQLNVQRPDPVTNAPIASVFNAGGAKLQGIEVELQALLFDSLRLSFNGDFAEPRYTRFDDLSVPGGSRVHEPVPYVPDYRVSGAIENRFSLGGEMALTPRIQVTRTGERYLFTDAGAAARAAGRVAPVTLTDASLKFDLNEQISIDVYGKNVFNKKYINDALSFNYFVLNWYAPPVTYGITARYKF